MKIAVIGAGIVGMCTAYELAMDGHEVSIFERHAAVAEEASFACAGNIAPSLSHPLAFPAWPLASRLHALRATSGIALGRGATLRDLRWLLGWKSPGKNVLDRFDAAQALASYSQQRMHTIVSQAALVFEQSQGQLVLFQSEAELAAHQEKLNRLKELGVAGSVLTADQARNLEPALATGTLLQGAIYFPNDEIGNCRQFGQLLKDKLLERGAQLHFNTTVTAISPTPRIQVHTQNQESHSFERLVICAGTGAGALMGPGVTNLTLTRLWSSSVSIPIREPLNAPHSAVLDAHKHVSISRMGARIRISGAASLGEIGANSTQKATQQLFQTLQNHFPGAADFSRTTQTWRGCSIFSPDALPLVGPGNSPDVWLNLAHGHNGWSMACGAARLVADGIGGRPADIDTTFLHPDRFKS